MTLALVFSPFQAGTVLSNEYRWGLCWGQVAFNTTPSIWEHQIILVSAALSCWKHQKILCNAQNPPSKMVTYWKYLAWRSSFPPTPSSTSLLFSLPGLRTWPSQVVSPYCPHRSHSAVTIMVSFAWQLLGLICFQIPHHCCLKGSQQLPQQPAIGNIAENIELLIYEYPFV